MTQEPAGEHRALDRIVDAERSVRDAYSAWNAVDLAAIGSCVSSLECSASDLSAAIEILKQSPGRDAGALRRHLFNLRRAAAVLMRLVDASAAFLRSAPGAPRDEAALSDAGLYQAGGVIFYTVPPSQSRGMQV